MKKLILLLSIFFIIFSIQQVFAPDVSYFLRPVVEEEDGSPSNYFYKLKVPNGTLTDNEDGTCSIASGGGSGSVTTIKDEGTQLGGADIVTLAFGVGFDLTESPDTEVNIALDAELLALLGLTSAANKLPYFTGSGTADVTTLSAYMRGIIDDADEATFKATVNLEPGTDIQVYDAELAAIAGLTSAANKLPYFTGSGTADITDLSAYIRGILDDVDEATFKATVNLESGTDIQTYDAFLQDIADLTDPAANQLLGWDNTDNDIRFMTIGTGLSYNAATDILSATGSATAYDDITDPDASGGISFGAYTGTYTSATDGWGGVIISNTQATITIAGPLLTLQYTDGEGDTTGEIEFLKMIANSVTLFDADEDGLKIGNGTPTQTMDGEDVYIEGFVEVDGIIYADGGITCAPSEDPLLKFDALDADDTDWWIGVNTDAGASSDDNLEIRTSATPGSNIFLTIEPASGSELVTSNYSFNLVTGKTYQINGSQISSDNLSDVGSLAMLDEIETISGNWVNTANPWADNEVANNLTIDGGTIDNTIIGGSTPAAISGTTGTYTGTLSGELGITLDTAATVDLSTASNARGALRINNDNDVIDYTLPPAEAGLNICFYSRYAQVVTVDVDDGVDVIILDGTALTAGYAIDSAGGAGDYICLACIDETYWITLGRSGTWVDGGAD